MAGIPEILALATIGYLINSDKSAPKQQVETFSKQKKITKQPQQVEKYVEQSSENIFDDYSYFDDDASMSDVANIIDKISNLTDNRKFEACIAGSASKGCTNKDSWIHQLDPLTFDNNVDPVSSNNLSANDMALLDTQRDLETSGFSTFDMTADGTYGIVKPDSNKFFLPGTMPFVRRGPHPFNERSKAEVHNQKLELFTGVGNADWNPKVESQPLFAPETNKMDQFGMQPITQLESDRAIVGSERRNELPFEQIKVTPGLNLKPNAVGMQGFHDTVRPVYRTTDQLRVASNPKTSYPSYFPPVSSPVDNRPNIGVVYRNRPPPKTGRDGDDVVPSGISETEAPTIYGEVDKSALATVNRGTKSTPAIGPVKFDIEGTTPAAFRGRYQQSQRQNYLYGPPTNLQAHDALRAQGYNYDGMIQPLTNRNTTQYNTHYGMLAAPVERVQSFDPNIQIDPVGRNLYETRTYSGPVTEPEKQITAINYNDIADPTGRNLIETRTNGGFIATDKFVGHAVDFSDQHDLNMRAMTAINKTSGQITGMPHVRAFDDNTTVPVTMRSVYGINSTSGQISSDVPRTQQANYNDVADPTMRNLTSSEIVGNFIGNRLGNVAIDFNNISKLTMRSVNPLTKTAGFVTGDKMAVAAFDPNQTARMTTRNLITVNKQSANVTGNRELGPSVNPDTHLQKPTMRDTYIISKNAGLLTGNSESQFARSDKTFVPNQTERSQRPGSTSGNIGPYTGVESQAPREQFANMSVNEGKEALEIRPSPTRVGPDVGWQLNNVQFHFRTRDNPPITGLSDSNLMNRNDRLGFVNTKVPNRSLPDGMYNVIPIADNLRGNVYINNAIHKAFMKE